MMIGHSNQIEQLIQRVRQLIGFGLDLDTIIEQCSDCLAGEVILAWHAARILDKENDK